MELNVGDFTALTEAYCSEPHSFLGMHAIPATEVSKKASANHILVRALLPRAEACSVVRLSENGIDKEYPLSRIANSPIFEEVLTEESSFFP
ncbi:MAG: hypothetical protein DBX03_00625, partial [Puniceicoccaceae bacterium]